MSFIECKLALAERAQILGAGRGGGGRGGRGSGGHGARTGQPTGAVARERLRPLIEAVRVLLLEGVDVGDILAVGTPRGFTLEDLEDAIAIATQSEKIGFLDDCLRYQFARNTNTGDVIVRKKPATKIPTRQPDIGAANRYFRVSPRATIAIRHAPGAVVGEAILSGPRGPVRISGQRALAPITDEVKRRLSRRIGWSPSQIASAAEDIARRAAHINLARELSKIAADPGVQTGAAIAAAIYPPLGITYGAAAKAVQLVAAADGGNKDALTTIKAIVDAAKAGDPAAQKGAKVLTEVHAARREAQAQDQAAPGDQDEDAWVHLGARRVGVTGAPNRPKQTTRVNPRAPIVVQIDPTQTRPAPTGTSHDHTGSSSSGAGTVTVDSTPADQIDMSTARKAPTATGKGRRTDHTAVKMAPGSQVTVNATPADQIDPTTAFRAPTATGRGKTVDHTLPNKTNTKQGQGVRNVPSSTGQVGTKTTTFNADGTTTTTDVNGKATTTSIVNTVQNLDGSKTVTDSNGRTTTIAAPGGTLPPGIVSSQTNPDGSVTTIDAQGRIQTTYPPGTYPGQGGGASGGGGSSGSGGGSSGSGGDAGGYQPEPEYDTGEPGAPDGGLNLPPLPPPEGVTLNASGVQIMATINKVAQGQALSAAEARQFAVLVATPGKFQATAQQATQQAQDGGDDGSGAPDGSGDDGSGPTDDDLIAALPALTQQQLAALPPDQRAQQIDAIRAFMAQGAISLDTGGAAPAPQGDGGAPQEDGGALDFGGGAPYAGDGYADEDADAQSTGDPMVAGTIAEMRMMADPDEADAIDQYVDAIMDAERGRGGF